MLKQVVGVQRGVEAIEADVTGRIDLTDLFGHAEPQPQRCMHRNRYPHEAGAGHFVQIEALDGNVQPVRCIPSAFEERQRRGDAKGLMPELIAGDQQN